MRQVQRVMPPVAGRSLRRAVALALTLSTCGSAVLAAAQQSSNFDQQVQRISGKMSRLEAEIEQSQRELAELREELAALQRSSGAYAAPDTQPANDAGQLAAAVASLRETQAIHDSQIATLEQTKVESESKYPLKLSGLILTTAIVSTQGVDSAHTPTVAFHGSGSTAATLRQTTLGIEARGPHLLRATSKADARFDFYGSSEATGYNSGTNLGLLRMRTARAELDWQHANAFFALDRPLVSPDTPTSLTALSVPEFAWSGSLWTWNPQLGGSYDWLSERPLHLRAQAALIDLADPSTSYQSPQDGAYAPTSSNEQSRWPGVQARLALVNRSEDHGFHLGAGGIFVPHRLPTSKRFETWAATVDFHLPLSRVMELSGSAYEGQALGGLGGGAFKDYGVRMYGSESYLRAFDDVGGWAQWKQRFGQKLELNEAFGIDNVPAHQIRHFTSSTAESYFTLSRNRTITANAIFSPSAYLLFTLEYRRILSSFANSPTESSDIVGLGAGYRF